MGSAGTSAETRLGLPEYHGHGWAETFALVLLVLFVLSAMAGLFGDGPLSDATASSDDGRLRVDYQRFCRRQTPDSLQVSLPTQPGVNYVVLAMNSEFAARVQINEIFPAPQQSTHHQTGLLHFATDGSGEPLSIRFDLEPRHAGRQRAHFIVGPPGKHSEVRFQQLVYP